MDTLKETIQAQTKLQWMRDRGYTEEEIKDYLSRKKNKDSDRSIKEMD